MIPLIYKCISINLPVTKSIIVYDKKGFPFNLTIIT